MFDSDAALELIQVDAREYNDDTGDTRLPPRMQDALEGAKELYTRLATVRSCLLQVAALKESLELRREGGHVEGRSVTIIDFQWLEGDAAQPWFIDNGSDEDFVDRLAVFVHDLQYA